MTELYEYECEVCGKKEWLDENDAFSAGWDYPPFIGTWGIVSPRTCADCDMTDTAWWAITKGLELTEKHKETIRRINAETEPMDANKFASSIIKGITATFSLPVSLGEPVWGFLGLGGTELRRDELRDHDVFVVTRNGHPVAGVVKEEGGTFQVMRLDVEWNGNPEDNPALAYEEMFLEGL